MFSTSPITFRQNLVEDRRSPGEFTRGVAFAMPWLLSLCLVAVTAGCGGNPTSAAAPSGTTPQTAQWYVAPGRTGGGTQASPFGRIQDALDVASAGETVTVSAGIYNESIVTKRNGVRVTGVGVVTVTASGRVLDVQHTAMFEDLRLDGQFGPSDTVRVLANSVQFRRVEVFNSGRDCIDVRDVSGLLVTDSDIHDCVWAGNDAHGIVGGRMTGAVVRNTRIHDVTGDGIQLDANRAGGSWDLQVENVDIQDTGEDGIDTKTGGTGVLTVIGGTYRGFRNKTNSAAFNMKESVTVTVDGVTVSDANIGFRLRNPADVRVSNSSISNSDRGIRYEDGVVEHPLVSVMFTNVDQEIQRAN